MKRLFFLVVFVLSLLWTLIFTAIVLAAPVVNPFAYYALAGGAIVTIGVFLFFRREKPVVATAFEAENEENKIFLQKLTREYSYTSVAQYVVANRRPASEELQKIDKLQGDCNSVIKKRYELVQKL
jgi:hypothetical protein